MTEDVVQVLSQLNPIMEQLAGVDLRTFLKGLSQIPAAVVESLDGSPKEPSTTSRPSRPAPGPVTDPDRDPFGM
jgi:hypothetical protein